MVVAADSRVWDKILVIQGPWPGTLSHSLCENAALSSNLRVASGILTFILEHIYIYYPAYSCNL